jgi:lipoprotein NlpD
MTWSSPARGLAVAVVSLLAASCAMTHGGAALSVEHAEPGPRTPGGGVSHRVQRGQTLYRIARAYGVTVEELMDANRMVDPRELKAGEVLTVPGAKGEKRVPEFDAPEPEATPRTAGASSSSAPAPDKRQPKSVPVGTGTGALEWPLRGVLYARFGKKGKEPHDGIDLAAPAGQPVRTGAPGKVLFAGEQKGYGLIVIVEHEGGLITLYAHNRDLRVKNGQKVRQGQVVATVGDSGRTSGPHLHFEVRKDGVPVDPLDLLGPVPPA